MMDSNSTALVIAALMLVASISAVVARPEAKVIDPKPAMMLDTAIPTQFGDWRQEPQRIVRIISPALEATLDEIYNQILERSYVNAGGYRIMLSVAYGPDQRGALRAHDPEGCYVAQGFALHRKEASQLETRFGTIPVSRLFMKKGQRVEPVTFWMMLGDTAPQGWQRTLLRLSYTLTGSVPDGLVFRVSSIDPDEVRAIQLQDQFINELVMSVSPAERKHLSGLGNM